MSERIAILTAGGFAPCLSASLGGLIRHYTAVAPEREIIGYRHGYEGLLSGDFLVVGDEERRDADALDLLGGSPLGNSRVKLTNAEDLRRRGLIGADDEPLARAAARLVEDGVSILHTIGGDDTNTTAADLARYLAANDYRLTVVGLPKTIDNDVVPIAQTLGADTAADQGALFARNIVAEHNFMPRMLIVHEVMGRGSGWLTAETARRYRAWLDEQRWVPGLGLTREAWEVHAVYVPEAPIDLDAEAERLRRVMDETGCVTIFLSEGAGQHEIIPELEADGVTLPRDAFGHVLLDAVNPGQWFGERFAERIGAGRVMVQKSGFFARSAAANDADLRLIDDTCRLAAHHGLAGESGVVGRDEERSGELGLIDFERIAGGKPFDVSASWFRAMLRAIGQG
ncbi:MAG: pyrophosphate--fructose-6-phosphate 1-phosphotransferase [Propionibacterium sp.]|nr:pyrophosphate--fructose-6-phosphate 1-phosphotransferase [Propionibacterium sp.]